MKSIAKNNRFCKLIPDFVDLTGDKTSALLLGQICYWFEPAARTGKPKLTVQRDGRMWLAAPRSKWYEECRISINEYNSAIRKLLDLGVVETCRMKWGKEQLPTPHIWLNSERLELLIVDITSESRSFEIKTSGSSKKQQRLLDKRKITIQENKEAKTFATDVAEFSLENKKISFRGGKKQNPAAEVDTSASQLEMNNSTNQPAEIASPGHTNNQSVSSVLPTKSALIQLWNGHMENLEPTGFKQLTNKDAGQLQQLWSKLSASKAHPIELVDWALLNWSTFAYEVRKDKALSVAPLRPVAGFLLAHYDVALRSIAKEKDSLAAKTVLLPKEGKTAKTTPRKVNTSMATDQSDNDKPVGEETIFATMKALAG